MPLSDFLNKLFSLKREVVTGRASVIDGASFHLTTFEGKEMIIRLHKVELPGNEEKRREAFHFLRTMIEGDYVICTVKKLCRNGERIAIVRSTMPWNHVIFVNEKIRETIRTGRRPAGPLATPIR